MTATTPSLFESMIVWMTAVQVISLILSLFMSVLVTIFIFKAMGFMKRKRAYDERISNALDRLGSTYPSTENHLKED